MFYNYIYKNKETGQTVYSQKELKDDKLELKSSTKNASMKSSEVLEKSK